METIPQTFRGSHVITNQEVQQVIDQVETFRKDKKDFEVIYNSTPVMAGIQNGHANMVVIVTALCMWTTTPQEFKAWRNRFELSGQKIF